VPRDLDDVRGVVILGGPQNIGDADAWLSAEAAFIRKAHDANLPVLGICLGAQLIAHALGGKVARMPEPEVGFMPVRTLDGAAQTEILLAGIPWQAHVFHAHACEVVEPPPGAMVLQSSDRCRVQCFRVGLRTIGFQYHFEVDRPMIGTFCGQFEHLLESAGVTCEQIQAQADKHYDRMAVMGDRLALNFVNFAFPFAALTRA